MPNSLGEELPEPSQSSKKLAGQWADRQAAAEESRELSPIQMDVGVQQPS